MRKLFNYLLVLGLLFVVIYTLPVIEEELIRKYTYICEENVTDITFPYYTQPNEYVYIELDTIRVKNSPVIDVSEGSTVYMNVKTIIIEYN